MKSYTHSSVAITSGTSLEGEYFIGPNCIIGFPSFQNNNNASSIAKLIEQPSKTKIGNNARIFGNVVIGQGTKIGQNVRIDYGCYIGDNVTIGDNCVIEYGARVYDRCYINNNSTISGFLCNEVTVGKYCEIQGQFLHKRTSCGKERAARTEDYVFVGSNSMIIGDIILRSNSYVGAGAIVTKSTQQGKMYYGNPAIEIGNAPRWQ